MPRRGHPCRCCESCNDCDTPPTWLIATLDYPAGSGQTIAAHPQFPAVGWSAVTTTCGVPTADVGIANVKITAAGEGYTAPPLATLTGGGGTYSKTATTIRGGLDSIKVTDSGSGYTSSPTVTISNPGGGGQIEKAVAHAVIQGTVVGVTLQSKGQGFRSPPTITILGGTGAKVEPTMDGYVDSITVTNFGEGYKTPPTVTLSGGGGKSASAAATISSAGTVSGINVINAGSKYSSPPTVKISGGEGKGAEAVANLLFKVDSISLSAGGSGYPLSPDVVVEGGGGGGVSISAQVEGKVAAVEVLDPGLYQLRQQDGQAISPNWPTVTIAGNAKISATCSGGVHAVEVFGSRNYSSIPEVTFSGGGGSKAAALAELTWQRSNHERATTFDNCAAQLSVLPVCFDVSGNKLPSAAERLPSQFFHCVDNHAEGVGWSVQASSAAAYFDTGELGLTRKLIFLQDETVWCLLQRLWFVPGQTPFAGFQLGGNNVRQTFVTLYTKPFFSRVEPDVVYRLRTPQQIAGQNCTLTPTFRHYVDKVGQSFWYLEQLALTFVGQNLFVPPGAAFVTIAADGNTIHEIALVGMTFSRTPPTFALADLPEFVEQPEVHVSASPVGSDGLYQINSVSLTSGGQTSLADGTVELELLAVTGYWLPAATRFVFSGIISGGQLASISVGTAPSVAAPATVASVTLPPDPLFSFPVRVTAGRSLYRTDTTHSEPTVTATCEPQFGGESATLGVQLAQETDLNGRAVWRVQGVSIESGGSGYNNGQPILFEVVAPGIEAAPAVATVFAEDGVLVGAEVQFGGEYFERQITETSDMLPQVSCIGPVSTQAGWQKLERDMISDVYEWFDVNEEFSARYQPRGAGFNFNTLSRTRRCDLPTITLELQ